MQVLAKQWPHPPPSLLNRKRSFRSSRGRRSAAGRHVSGSALLCDLFLIVATFAFGSTSVLACHPSFAQTSPVCKRGIYQKTSRRRVTGQTGVSGLLQWDFSAGWGRWWRWWTTKIHFLLCPEWEWTFFPFHLFHATRPSGFQFVSSWGIFTNKFNIFPNVWNEKVMVTSYPLQNYRIVNRNLCHLITLR